MSQDRLVAMIANVTLHLPHAVPSVLTLLFRLSSVDPVPLIISVMHCALALYEVT